MLVLSLSKFSRRNLKKIFKKIGADENFPDFAPQILHRRRPWDLDDTGFGFPGPTA
jgi:hypothetical protein